MSAPSREVPIDPAHTALLIVDVQNYCAHPDGAGSHKLDARQRHYLFHSARNGAAQSAASAVRLPSRTYRGRLRGGREHDPGRPRPQPRLQDGIDLPRGSWEARVLDEIAPVEDEMIFRKTSSSVFISTNIDYVLRNLGLRSLIIAGMMTDQCVESAERHEQSLFGIRGYCRQRTTDLLLAEIGTLTASR
jgi:ureidoacrylate peracid hydrolase